MSISYEEWCKSNTDIIPLVRSLKSSVPEQYITFYLRKVFGEEVESQKQFAWLGKQSLDIYIPSLQLAIEYDGEYYHRNKTTADMQKTALCNSHDIYLIRIQEMKVTQEKNRKENVVSYYYEKNYSNINVALQSLGVLINQKYGTSIQFDADLDRDRAEIISSIQNQYYKKTIAYVWPESKKYWLEEENQLSIYDAFYTDTTCYFLQCPYCRRNFALHTRYFHHRKSLIPCECEYGEIESAFEEAIRKYMETGELVIFDDSLSSRRLYDRMEQNIRFYLRTASKEEMKMYKKLGFESPRLDYYLSLS